MVVFTDGASEDNQDDRIRRARFGAHWGLNHSKNVAELLTGKVQTNQRAELQAVVRVLDWEARPVEIRSDSQWVCDGAHAMLRSEIRSGKGDHEDLWQRLAEHLTSRPMGNVVITKVKGHATVLDVCAGKTTDKKQTRQRCC